MLSEAYIAGAGIFFLVTRTVLGSHVTASDRAMGTIDTVAVCLVVDTDLTATILCIS
jgi:hypothetical protein